MRRPRLRTALAFAALAFIVALPPVHWRMIGWCRGERFYLGRPVSYYRPICRSEYGPPNGCCSASIPNDWPRVRWLFGDRVADWLMAGPNPLFQGDPAAVPVLVVLLEDPDWDVRLAAASCLARVGPAAKAGLTRLRTMRAESDEKHYNFHFLTNCIAAIEGLEMHDGRNP